VVPSIHGGHRAPRKASRPSTKQRPIDASLQSETPLRLGGAWPQLKSAGFYGRSGGEGPRPV